MSLLTGDPDDSVARFRFFQVGAAAVDSAAASAGMADQTGIGSIVPIERMLAIRFETFVTLPLECG